MATFLPGRELAGAFHAEVVADLVGDVPHAAAMLGWGSDVLGYDTARSTDHGWGPRLQVFVAPDAVSPVRRAVDAGLPATFRGWPVRYGWDDVPPRHWVDVTTLDGWLDDWLGFVLRPDGSAPVATVSRRLCDRPGPAPRAAQLGGRDRPGRPEGDHLVAGGDERLAGPQHGVADPTPVATLDWLATPQMLLLGITAGAVFRDDGGGLAAVREALAWYPDQVWLWLLACQWQRLSQEEAFVGRTAEVGDDLGSRLVAARLARDVVRLCFLLERRYAPYSKWLGTAFAALDAAAEVGPALSATLAASDPAGREQGLAAAYEAVARRCNALGLTDPVDPATRPYHGRPFRVLHAERFAAACAARITDPVLRRLPLVGGVDQALDTTDLLSDAGRARRYRALLDGLD